MNGATQTKVHTGAKKSTKKGWSGLMTWPGKSSGARVWTLDVALSLANTAISCAVYRPVWKVQHRGRSYRGPSGWG